MTGGSPGTFTMFVTGWVHRIWRDRSGSRV